MLTVSTSSKARGAGGSITLNSVRRGAVAIAFGLSILVACSHSGPTPVPSPGPVISSEEPTVVFQDPDVPGPQALPEASAPGNLGAVTLPGDADDIAAVFGQLPPQVAGQPRTTSSLQRGPGDYDATYGDAGAGDCSPLRLQARDVSSGEFLPGDWTADVFISWWTLGADWEVTDAGREGSLFWVRWNTFCGSEPSPEVFPVYSLIWGNAGSRWVFTAQSDTTEELEALIAAFVTAAGD